MAFVLAVAELDDNRDGCLGDIRSGGVADGPVVRKHHVVDIPYAGQSGPLGLLHRQTEHMHGEG